MEVKFYKNKDTNEISLSLHEINDNNLIPLKANSTDAALEKHVPVVTVGGNKVHVEVGSTIHPMTEAHHIAFIALVTDKKVDRKNLEPTSSPIADFVLADGEKVLEVYEYCNLHGLWVKKL